MGIFDSTTRSKSEVIPYDPGQLNDMLSRLRTAGSTPMQFFPGQTYAALDPRQTEALGIQEDYARNLGGMVDPTMKAWRSTLTAPDVASNPYVQNMIQQQAGLLNRNLQENILPSIGMGALGVGQFGGSRQGVAEGIAARGTQEALARTAAETQLDAYNRGLAQQRYGLKAAPGMVEFGMRPAGILGDIGSFYRAEDQRGIDEARERFEFEQSEPWQRLQMQASLFNPLTLPYRARRGETTKQASDLQKITQGLGLVSSIGGMARKIPGFPGFGTGTPEVAPTIPASGTSYGAGLTGGGTPGRFLSPASFNFNMYE